MNKIKCICFAKNVNGFINKTVGLLTKRSPTPADEQEMAVAEGVDRNAEQRTATDGIFFYFPALPTNSRVKNYAQPVKLRHQVKKKRR